MGEDGSVVIGVDLNVKEAERELSRLTKKVLQLEEEIGRAGAHRDALKEQWEQATKALEEYKSANSKVMKGASTPFFDGDPEKLKELTENVSKLEKEMEKYDEQIKQSNIDLEYTKQRYAEIATEEQRLRKEAEARKNAEKEEWIPIDTSELFGDPSDAEENLSMFDRFKERVQEGLNSLKLGFVGLGRIASSAIITSFRGIAAVAKTVAKVGFDVAKKAAEGLAKATAFVAKSGFGAIKNAAFGAAKGIIIATKNLNAFSGIANKIGPAISKLGSMIRRVFVFSVITSGLRMLREKMSEYLSANSQLSNSLGQLKGALLTAFNPILEHIIPILNTLINVMARAMAVVAQFVATLFGTTAKQANANAKSLKNQAAATSGAGKAAKEASKSLAAFDEINKLDGKSDSGGGGSGGGGGINAGDSFDLGFDETAFDSWGEAFLWLLDQIDSGIARMKEAFGRFAVWFNDFNQKVYDMFTFPGVRDKVAKIGDDLADAFNYLVNSIDWSLWGMALGAGLDLALLFLVNAVYGFDWMNLGRSLASFVNGLASQIDWHNFGLLLWAGFKIGIETLAGFLLGLNMPTLAQAASRLVTGFIDGIYNTINSVNWAGIGGQITAFFTNINWSGIAKSANRMINRFFLAAHEFVTETKWGEIGAVIVGFIVALDWSGVGAGAGQLVVDFINALSGFFALSDWVGIGKQVTEFIVSLNWAGVAASASNLVIDFFDAITRFVDGINWAELGRQVTDFVNGINWSGVANSASELVKNFFNSLTEFIANIDWFFIGNEVMGFMLDIDWFGIIQTVFSFIGSVFDGLISFFWGLIKAAWDRLTQFWRNHIEGKSAEEIIAGLYQGIVNALSGIGSWIVNNIFAPFMNGFKRAFGIASPSAVMAEMGRYMIDGLYNGLKGIWDKVSGLFNSALTNIKNVLSFNAFKNIGSNMIEGIFGGLQAFGKKITNWGSSFIKGVKDFFGIHSPSTEFESLGDYMMAGLANGTSDGTSSVVNTFKIMYENIYSLCSQNVNEMKKLFAEFLKYITTQFSTQWSNAWQSFYTNLNSSIQKSISSINSLKSALASIERNITVTVTQKTVTSTSTAGTSSGTAKRSIFIPDGIQIGPIPALAQGTVIPPNRAFLAVLGDQSSGTNVEAPLSTIEQAVENVLTRMGVAGGSKQEAVFEVDGVTFAKLIYRLSNQESSRIGASLVEG